MPTPLPEASEWTGSTVTEGQFKSAQNNLRAYLAGLLGVDGTTATALAVLGAFPHDTIALSGATTVVASHRGKVLLCSGSWTLSLAAAATLGDGFGFALVNTGSGTITVDPSSTETIDGATTLAIGPGDSALIVCTGAAWRSMFRGGAVKVSSNDTTAGFLNGKLVAGSGIQFTENSDGSNESLTIRSDQAASAVQGAVNVGTGSPIFRDKSGTTLNFRTLAAVWAGEVSGNAITGLSFAVNGDRLELRYNSQPVGGGACFLPGTLVRLADGTWCPIEEIAEGTLLDGGPYGQARVLGIHRPKLGARWLWDLGPVRVTGDHLVRMDNGRWGCIEPAIYAKLREVEWLEIESGGEKRRIRMGAAPSIEIERVTPGALLWTVQGALRVTPVRVRESNPEQELIGLWTDAGAYVVQGGLVVDGFPQW